LKIDFDQANARQRARLNVVDSTAQGEESFERVSDTGLNLLRRHAGIKRRYHHDRDVDWWE
jgi:hypothetical protein